MQKTIILLILSLSLHAEVIELPLSRFAGLVASKHKVNIIIPPTIDKDSEIFYIESTDKDTFLMNPFKKLLDKKGYLLKYDGIGKFYYIEKKEEHEKSYYVKLNSPLYEELKPVFKMMDIKHSYIANSNALIYVCSDWQQKQVNEILRDSDFIPEQVQLKISILETNLNDVKERGTNLQVYTQDLKGDTKSFLQLITTPYTSTINTFDSSTVGITGVLRYLDNNSYTKILSSPYFTVQSNKEIKFNSTTNIPYKTGSTEVVGASSSASESIQYKDVGLKITLLPKLVKKIIYIDLDLVIENILDKQSLTPSTSSRSLTNHFQLKKGQVLVLSGISQEEKQTNEYGVPILKDIPLLGALFGFKTDEVINRNLTIMIELI